MDQSAPTFVKQVPTKNNPVGEATLYVSGLGFFRAMANGVDLHRRADPPIYLTPGWTNYELTPLHLVRQHYTPLVV